MSPGRMTAAMVLLGTLVACGGDGSNAARGQNGNTSSLSSATSTGGAAPMTTAELDSIAVLGHSGATGTMSDPHEPWRDATENSWATGENPDVRSIYQRLAAHHPAMQGHNYNFAVNGSTVDNIEYQLKRLLMEAKPLPDIVIVQTIDNDMRCDGSDPDNYARFGESLDQGLRKFRQEVPGVAFFLVSQWASAKNWAAWAAGNAGAVAENSGTGPCDVLTPGGKVRKAGVASIQAIMDGYWAQIERVCSALPDCYTDNAALQGMTLTDRDVAQDHSHLTIEGHAKMAALAWEAFPAELKQLE